MRSVSASRRSRTPSFPMSDPLDIWRSAFQEIVPEDGQMQLWLGAESLEQVATLDEVEAQARKLADESE